MPHMFTNSPRIHDLFLLGGVFNYWRACVVMRDAIRRQKESNSTSRSAT